MSCCANIALDPDILSTPADLSNLQQSSSVGINLPPVDFFLSEALRSRRYHNVADTQSLAQVQTSFFLYCIYFCLNNDNAAWFYIREAMTILQTLRYHEEATYNEIADASTKKYARRIFWVLFITERAYAMQRHRPLTLQPMLDLPQIDPLSPDVKILPGFLELISLFRPFDTDFIATWNSSTPSSTSKSAEPEQLARLQNTLSNALANVSNFSPMQQADLLITREWLKVIVWKLCVSRTLLSGTDSEDSMSLSYPTTIARDTVLVSRLLPTTAFEANGVGILEKVFDVGCSLADLLSLNPPTIITSVMDVGPIDILMETQQHCEYHNNNIQLQQFYRIIIINLKLDPHFLNLFVIIVLPLVDVNFVVFDEFEHPFGKQFRPAIVQQYAIKISYYLRPVTNYTAPPMTDANGNQYEPVVPIAVPAAGGGAVVPPVGGGGGGGGGGAGGGGADDTTTTSNLPSSTPLNEPSAAPSSAPPTSASPSSSQEPSSTVAAIDTTSSPLVVITFEPATTTSIVEVVTEPAASTTTVAAPVPCYNYEWKSYGWCCPGPDSPCENSLGTCYFDGSGATNVLPNTAACPPAPDARH
ncbi:putative sucrose utilization protein SUC1 [Colletotrichum siamense]|uniref:Sucrose utilization protein SUC1 n=1 Tax=Colletotrichum siamense TaxID=690259 RepID=A0A9P5KAE0_COLSI|nr:putative sucrose utilization protein SUC1 [Colletotrichum siamense]KAF4866330.1 putative sucrose utilization protein SUC1 [Colletotrichum siamense]